MIGLRRATKDDIPHLQEAYARSVSLHLPWTYAPEDFERYVEQEGRYLVYLLATGEIVGTFNISGIVRGWFQSAYLGYEVFAPFQGLGYMSRAMPMLIHEAFVELKLHRLEASIQPENRPSLAFIARHGFVNEGFSKAYLRIGGKEWKDHERWALLNTEWAE